MYNILIVDDGLLNRKLMRGVLSDTTEELVFFEAENGEEATEILRKQEIDLIILDLVMPIKDGYAVLEEIKNQERYIDIPVIVNSANTDMDSIQQTLELGAIDYFTKPLTPAQMQVIIPLKVNNALKYYRQKRDLKKINERMQTELKVGSILQQSLIKGNKNLNFIDAYISFMPCHELGGDLYDYVEIEDECWFIIADVKGQGVAAAMISSMLKALFNSTIKLGKSPNAVLEEMNKSFCNITHDKIDICFSAFIGVVKDDLLIYANAGHPDPIVIHSKDGKCMPLEQSGQLMGMFDDIRYDSGQIDFEKEDIFIGYTDGLYNFEQIDGYEYKDEQISFEKEDILDDYGEDIYNLKKEEPVIINFQLVHKYVYQNIKNILEDTEQFMINLLQEFKKWDGNNYSDDITVMIMKKK